MGQHTRQVCDEVVGEWIDPSGPGAAVAVMRGGEPSFLGSYGLADIEHGTPVTEDTRFFIGSVSKQFCGACIALLIEEGLLSLTDGVREYVPELAPFADPITIEHLLRHVGGLGDAHLLLVLAGWRNWDVMTHDDALGMILRLRRGTFPAGQSWSYSNSGYVLLAEVLERVTGSTIRSFAEERLFVPLGMRSTLFHDDPTEPVENRARGYSTGKFGRYRLAEVNSGMVGTTGIFTTGADMARWDRNLRTGELGGQALIQRMTSAGALNDGTPVNYGFGLALTEFAGRRAFEHNGLHGGTVTHYIHLPDDDLSVFFSANCSSIPMGTIASGIARRLLDDSDAPARLEPCGPLAIPTGVYRDREAGYLKAVRVTDEGVSFGVGSRAPVSDEPSYYVEAPETLVSIAESGLTAGLGENDRNTVTFDPDRDQLVLQGLDHPVAVVFDRIGEVEAESDPPAGVAGVAIGSFSNPDLGIALSAKAVGEWLSIEGSRFGPVLLAPLFGCFARGGITVELEPTPAAPAALILRADSLRPLRLDRVEDQADRGAGAGAL